MEKVTKQDVIKRLKEIPDDAYIDPDWEVYFKDRPWPPKPKMKKGKPFKPLPPYSEVMHQVGNDVQTNWHRRDTCRCVLGEAVIDYVRWASGPWTYCIRVRRMTWRFRNR